MTHTVELAVTKAQMEFLMHALQPVERFVDDADNREHLLAWFYTSGRLKLVVEL